MQRLVQHSTSQHGVTPLVLALFQCWCFQQPACTAPSVDGTLGAGHHPAAEHRTTHNTTQLAAHYGSHTTKQHSLQHGALGTVQLLPQHIGLSSAANFQPDWLAPAACCLPVRSQCMHHPQARLAATRAQQLAQSKHRPGCLRSVLVCAFPTAYSLARNCEHAMHVRKLMGHIVCCTAGGGQDAYG